MLQTVCLDTMFEFLCKLYVREQRTVEREVILGIKADDHYMILLDIHRLLLIVGQRRELAHDSLVRVHRRCHEKEDQQHERDISR